MKTKKIATNLLLVGLIVGGIGSSSMIQSALADDATTATTLEEPKMNHGHAFMDKVERTFEDIENGVIIRMTTDDPDTLTKLQNMTEFPKLGGGGDFMDGVDLAINLLDDGIQVTLTSEDADTVTKLHNLPKTKKDGPGDHKGHGPLETFLEENVDRSVENIDNGIVITLTSDDPEMVTRLQSFPLSVPEYFVEE